ncbi:cytochrome C assembly family protein [Salinisphaera hydrothermalis]|uniref:Cytochrome C assembly protein n=1 Tax=Salinisphaera hydrothermalis (strain C41B8) TaxID=1304275 RepID=A0A084IH04_SALHC|nr:cytochrome c biogenesis protein CcsA [Salinisphaera hydrothermalis]KEZ75988.1 cytochrome C assembly protein [Salinisphaera hydrothermalis C41B8]
MTFVIIEVLLATTAYAAATYAVYQHHATGAPYLRVTLLAGLGLVMHMVALVHMTLHTGAMIIGVGSALSLFAWQAALLLWLFSLKRSIGALGLVMYPLAGLCAIAGLLVPDPNGAREALDWPLQAHIMLSMLAYGLLTLGAVQAAVLSLQHRQLRQHPPSGLFTTLPPLQTMETLLFRLIGAGFFMLSLAIATGALFISHLFEQHLAHKAVLSVAAWLVFAILLFGRWRYGWRGRLAVRGVMIGYVVLVFAYFGSKLVLELILGEHWW